jgi:hypothetical protein
MNIDTIKIIGRQVLIEPGRDRRGWPIAVIQADPTDPHASPEDRKVRLIGDDWAIALPNRHVNDVTIDQIRTAMKLPDTFQISLTSERIFPDYAWISTQMLDWMDAWRCETLAESNHILLANAS